MLRRLALLTAALALTGAPAAAADGDPASDVLPTEDVFYPYTPPASKPLVETLDKLLEQVRKAGYPMKVALIASAGDLGSYPQLFNNPQEYANLLASELPSNPHGEKLQEALHLLIVMPGGFGGKELGDRVDEALAPVEIDPEALSDGLVRAAIVAVARIATVNGHKTEVPPLPEQEGEDSGGSSPLLYVVIGTGLLLLLGLVGVLVRRRRSSDGRPDGEPPAQAEDETARST